MIGTAIVILLMFGAFATFDFRSNVSVGIISSLVGIIVFGAVLTFAIITVHIDAKSITVRSTAFRFKLASIPLDEVSEVTIEPFSKTYWGGWGLRLRGRDRAIVLKGTEAAVIEKKTGQKVYLAAQDAPRIAETLKSYTTRRSEG